METGFVSGRADILPPFASDGGISLNLGELIGVVVPDVKLSLGTNNQDNVSHLKHGLVGQSQRGWNIWFTWRQIGGKRSKPLNC